MFNLRHLAAVGALLVAATFGPVSAHAAAGTVILEGSDAIGFHCTGGNSGACVYANEVWSAIGGASPLPIAVIGTGTFGAIPAGTTHTTDNFATLAAAGSLSQYVALYFVSADGCCTQDDSLITAPGAAAAVAAYLAAGGTVMIENYTGGTAWDFAVGAGGAGNQHVAGVGGGLSSSLGCDDGETVTATGLTNGFTQPPALGCWTHQAYDSSFFGAKMTFLLPSKDVTTESARSMSFSISPPCRSARVSRWGQPFTPHPLNCVCRF